MIDLSKGSRINLAKEAPGATKFILGMGWDTRITDGAEFDLDASALLLDENDKPVGEAGSLVFTASSLLPVVVWCRQVTTALAKVKAMTKPSRSIP